MTIDDSGIFKKFVITKEHLNLLDSIPEAFKVILKKIDTLRPFFMYLQAEEFIKTEIDPRFRDADQDMNNRGRILFFYGDYDTGKTYLLHYVAFLLKEKYEIYWKKHIDVHPIVYIALRDDINTAKQLMLYLLDQLGKPVDPKQLKEWEKTNIEEVRLRDKIISTLEGYQTRIIILDECQRLLKSRNPDIPNIFEAIKDLTTRSYWNDLLRTHFVLCGTQDGFPLLEAAQWIQGRAHTIQLTALTEEEYGEFLWQLYDDYVGMGIPEQWDFVIDDKKTGDKILNPEISVLLFKRSHGKVGLTVELVRDAVKRALNAGRAFPNKDDYKLVIVEGEKVQTVNGKEEDLASEGTKTRIIIGYGDRNCRAKSCKQSNKPYSTLNFLIQHYKKKHPDIEIVNREGGRM